MAKRVHGQESSQDQAFVSFLASLPEKPPTTMRFFERNNYYTVHGKDAIFVAKDVFKTSAVLKTIGTGPQKTESVCLSKLNFESLVREMLLVRQYRVEVYANKSSGRTQEWGLEYKASPGNLTELEDVLFNDDAAELVDSRGVMAIKFKPGLKELEVGIAFGDAILRELKLCEFSDSVSLSNLEAVVIQLSPKECLLAPSQDHNVTAEVHQILKRNNILLTDSKGSDFNAADVMQDLNNLVTKEHRMLISNETEKKLAVSCLSAIVKYLQLTSNQDNFDQFSLMTYNMKNYMTLDGSAMKALDVLPKPREENRTHSLLGLLNRCRTAQGQRLLARWINQPLMDVNQIEERLDIVESFVNNTELRMTLRDNFLRKFPDFHILGKKIQMKKAHVQDLYKVYAAVEQLPILLDYITKLTEPNSVLRQTFIKDVEDRISDFVPYQQLIKIIVDLEAAENKEYILQAESSEELKKIRKLMMSCQEQINSQLDKVAKDLGLEPGKTIKLENCWQIGYYFRVTRKEEKALRNKKNYITIDTKQSGVRFTNASLKQLNDKYLSLRNSYEETQKTMVQQIVDVAASYNAPMVQIASTIAHLDVFLSFATAAFEAPKPYVRPKIREKGERGILLKQARHPCLEMQPHMNFIPNDVSLEKDKQNFYFVTGPNMGGKSTFIRSVALNVLMAQIGSYVACDEADISIVDTILTRVGAGDKPLKGVSTFMAEMIEVQHILKCATSDSLIIMDELGRGTSTYDGLGLAWALSEHISTAMKAYCLFTTHFHELASLSKEVSSVGNLHVSAITSEDDITFMYKVEPGVCDQSFGIHVAEMANFPKSVINFAKLRLAELESCKSDLAPDVGKNAVENETPMEDVVKFVEDAGNIVQSNASESLAVLTELKNQLHSQSKSFAG